MKPTERESIAVVRLAEALLEFVMAYEEGLATRQPRRSRPLPPNTESERQTGQSVSNQMLLNAEETAEYLSISRNSLWSWTAPRGTLPCVRIGSSVRYSRVDLDAFIEQSRILPTKRTRT